MSYNIRDYCGITSWIARADNLPFIFDEIYYKANWIAVLPVKSDLWHSLEYKNIKDLYIKMLAVLALPRENLLKAIMIYDEDNFTTAEQTSFTLKLLHYAPRFILICGELNFLDNALLKTRNIWCKKILHPQHLLKHPQDKKIAYQDLLACKKINFEFVI